MTRPRLRRAAVDAASGSPTRTSTVDPTQQVSYVVPPCPRLPHRAAVQDGLPDLTLPCLGGGGRQVRLADLRGTPTALVWAACCPPCAEEMPVLAEGMHRAVDRVRFFGVAFPSVQDTDGDDTVLALRATAPPQTFFHAADGTLAGRHAGAITAAEHLDELVQQYLGARL